jgi:hypothetical protein
MIAITMKQDELSLNKVLLALLIFLGVYLVNYKPSQKKMAAD